MTTIETPALLQHLAGHVGLSALPLDADGCCALRVGEDPVLTFRWLPDDELLILFCALGTLGLERRAALLADLLRANHFWRGTAGATLSIDADEPPRAVLQHRFDARQVSPAEFVQAVEWFAESAATWRRRLDAAAPAGATGAAAAPPMPGAMPSFA